MVLSMVREEIKKKIIKGTTWSDVMKDLNKVTRKITYEKDSSEADSSSDKT